MKTSNITKSALALALGLCASGALALTTTNAFENFTYADGTAVTNLNSTGLNWSAGADALDYTVVNANKLVVDTGDSSVTGALSNATAFNNNIANSASFEAKVSFTPATETPAIGGADLKFALYAKTVNDSTTLFVYANNGETDTELPVVANTETTVKVDFQTVDTFKVSVGGGTPVGPYTFANSGSIAKLEFAGNGTVDDLAFSYEATPYTMTWVADSASYIVDGVTNSLAGESSPFTYYGEPGQTVKIKGKQGYMIGETAVVAGSSTALVLDSYSQTLADYFANGEGTAANPYQIATANDLIALKDAVANVEAARSKSYIQTANIDMASAGAFAGIGTYDATPTAGTPFTGTYDGGNFKIMNVDFTQRNYGGVFNQVNGGTIKNLTVSNITCSAFSSSVNSGEWGGAIVGNAGNGATLQDLVAEGTFAADHAATHNVAGIVIRACAGGTGTLIKDCTNNATLYGAYTKIGGICAITQYKIAGGVVTFDGCVNNGDIISSRTTTGVTGYAGILGYNDDDSVLVNCSNTGSIVNNSGANTDKDGALVGWAYTKDSSTVRSLTDQGGNSAAKPDRMLASRSSLATVTGFQYATVANGVATTITGDPVAGGSYLLEGNATPSVSLALGETVTFDKSLGYTLTETGITTSAAGCEVVGSGTTTRTFSVAYIPVAVSYSAALDHLTAAWTVNGSSADKPDTLTNGDTYSVTFTAESGWAISDGEVNPVSGTAGTTAIVITVPAVEELPSYAAGDTTVIEGHTLTGDEASYLNALVTEKGASAVETALASIDEDDFVAAALLNQDITETNAGSYEFKVSSLKKKAGGKVEVKVTLTRSGSVLGKIKGTVVLKTCATPNGNYAEVASENIEANFGEGSAAATQEFTATFTGVTDKFFKAEIK